MLVELVLILLLGQPEVQHLENTGNVVSKIYVQVRLEDYNTEIPVINGCLPLIKRFGNDFYLDYSYHFPYILVSGRIVYKTVPKINSKPSKLVPLPVPVTPRPLPPVEIPKVEIPSPGVDSMLKPSQIITPEPPATKMFPNYTHEN